MTGEINAALIDAAFEDFGRHFDHIWVAYDYALSSVPREGLFANGRAVRVGRHTFAKWTQAESMVIELGWAFYCRMEACLETYVTKLGIRVGKSGMAAYLKEQGLWQSLTGAEQEGVRQYRDLRNILHHGDGEPCWLRNQPKCVQVPEGKEPHLLHEHMRDFRRLFKTLATLLKDAALAGDSFTDNYLLLLN